MSPVVALRPFLNPNTTAYPVSHTPLMATGLNSNWEVGYLLRGYGTRLQAVGTPTAVFP